MSQQTQEHPSTYNRDEVTRKSEQERQLVELHEQVREVIMLLKGTGKDNPGVAGRLTKLEDTIFGTDERMGTLTKVTIMWRIWVWGLCTASAAAGFFLRDLVKQFWHI